ncbi:uncharacterized protein MICPUCDRAFT_16944 [Micromonas pusilla CCMP1545]|uniref:Predicted protein n=1 Tax=Micromonas pusilla (strain CCMP1545) TaxID=564608 RepID=C1MS11_MICPC|nr:uncharacterized protein MICPUCDRAFT_16944 [Micromonas pusilla CCMP1545]EEH57423.1 predicted protein [Micromonas pusilla CCMP1545]|eukprot:XP_003058968.1 predicted protein [Micromonas pusilla CCMP1545]
MLLRELARRAGARLGPAAIGAGAVAIGGPIGVAACKDKDKEKTVTPSFDPEALERGAKALREINASPHAKNVIELARTQETTKAAEANAKAAEMQAAAAQHATNTEKVRWEEQRKTDQARAQQQGQIKEYEDELARKRYQHEHESTRKRNAEMVKMQEEASHRQENVRRATEEQIQQSRRETDRQKAEHERELIRAKSIAEAEGRIAENRANEDVIRRQMLAKIEAETNKAMTLLKETLRAAGDGVNALLADQTKGAALVGGLTALAAGVYGAREGSRMGFRMLERYLGQPSLVRETSRNVWGFRPSAPTAASAVSSALSSSSNGNGGILGEVVLERGLEARVRHLAVSTANTRKNNAPFRNVMLYGPPGTGKTMAAKRLARYSGLDYALMTGGDVAPLGADAVTRIHELFDWAGTSRRGLLLFIDEADAFLAKRGGGVAAAEHSTGVRAALNALLYRTGELSRDVVLVIATNRPEDLDAAVLDRMDEALEFGLPDLDARTRLCRLYFDKLIARGEDAGDDKPAQGFLGALGIGKGGKRGGGKIGTPIRVAPDVDDASIVTAAKKAEGFSGREIAKMMASVQGAVYGSGDAVLTAETFEAVVAYKVKEHAGRKAGFAAGGPGAKKR